MSLPPIFSSIVDKLKAVFHVRVHVENNRTNSPSERHITLMFFNQFNLRSLDDLNNAVTKLSSVVQKSLETNTSDSVASSEDLSLKGSLQMTKTTEKPTTKELEVLQRLRGNRPYNIISDVRIDYDENGNIIALQWNES